MSVHKHICTAFILTPEMLTFHIRTASCQMNVRHPGHHFARKLQCSGVFIVYFFWNNGSVATTTANTHTAFPVELHQCTVCAVCMSVTPPGVEPAI